MKQDPIELWHEIIAARTPERLDELLAEDAVMVSPVVHTPQRGKAITTKYLTAAVHVFGNESFRYLREFRGDHSAVLEFETQIGDVYVNGVDMLSWNDDGKVTEFRVMLRPLQAVHLIHENMGKMLKQLPS